MNLTPPGTLQGNIDWCIYWIKQFNGRISTLQSGGNGDLTVGTTSIIGGNPFAILREDGDQLLKADSNLEFDGADFYVLGQAVAILSELATVATTGDYGNLINPPNFASVALSGEYDDLLNVPSLAAIATTGDYADLNSSLAFFGGILQNGLNVYAQQNLIQTVTVSTNLATDPPGPYTYGTVLCDATAGAIVIDLPTAASVYDVLGLGTSYTIKKIDASVNTVTIKASGVELIDSANTKVISAQYTSVTIITNGTAWYII